MSLSDDMRLLAEIAHMYYDEGAKQIDVAEKFNISRSLVSKYLTRAKQIGLVEIIIHDDKLHPHRHIEEKLKRRYGLSDAVCISRPASHQLKKMLGIAGSKYLARLLKPNSVVGVSAGTGIYELASCFSPTFRMPNVTFVPMVGGLGGGGQAAQAGDICRTFSQNSDGECVELFAPVVVDTEEAKKMFMEQAFIGEVFTQARLADIALVGIGSNKVYSDMIDRYSTKYLSKNWDDFEVEPGIIKGDICFNFIDKNGQAIDCSWNRQVISITLSELKKIPLVLGVAGGKEKIDGVKSALNGNLLDVLITDEDCASGLI